MRYLVSAVLSLAVGLLAAPSLHAKAAADFPPGAWSDGRERSLEDYRGEVVVLFFYEAGCPRCTGEIPKRNEVVKQYRGKPVNFFAIAAGDSLRQAKSYGSKTKLAMPIFADNLSVMEKRYGTKISLRNIWQFRVIGPDGNIVGQNMDPATIDRALTQVSQAGDAWDPAEYPEKLHDTIEHANEGDYDKALVSLFRPLRDRDEAVKDAATRLQDKLVAHGQAKLDAAAALAEDQPIEAVKAYQQVEKTFGRHDLGKEAASKARELQKLDAVRDEAKAQKMYARIARVMSEADKDQRVEIAQFAASIFKKYPDTPTGAKAKVLAQELAAKQ